MDATIQYLVNVLPHEDLKDLTTSIKLDSKRKQAFFPLRPLVYGGDDSTFVCDARLALMLTPYLLTQFETHSSAMLKTFKSQHALPDFPDKLTACAGITIFKTHYPFARAYAMCEELCQSAKIFSDRVTGKTVAALDWQLAPSGRVNDLATLRDLQYADNRLTLRPVLIKSEQTWRTWQNVQNALDHFSHDWRERRNQLIAFQDVNRQGEKATDNWLQNLGIALKFAPFTHMEQAERPKAVWAEDKYLNNTRRSLYFDVIELLEHYRVLVP